MIAIMMPEFTHTPLPPVWPVVFGRARDSHLTTHLTVDAPPIAARLRRDYTTLCQQVPADADGSDAASYLTGEDALMLFVGGSLPGGNPVCEECHAAWEEIVAGSVSPAVI